ncbi:Ku protein [Streptomyces sp. NPDC054865]
MARPVWAGNLSFGLVSLPVGLYTATDSHTIHFHQLQRGTSDRIRNKRTSALSWRAAFVFQAHRRRLHTPASDTCPGDAQRPRT